MVYKRAIYTPTAQYVMDFREQASKLPVMNFDALVGERKQRTRHGDLLPASIRAVFCGPSNCGKTNALLALITHPNGLRFENVYVYSKSLNQPKYKLLEQVLAPLVGIGYFAFSEHDLVASPTDARPNSIIIFDDIACEKQDNVRAFYCMGRHKNIDCFYLSQSYAQIPKHLVRDNINLLMIFRQDDMNLRHVYDDHVNTDMPYTQFRALCAICWNDSTHGFLVIDKDRGCDVGRYRKGFDRFAINIPRSG